MCVGFGFWEGQFVKNKTSLGLLDQKHLDKQIFVVSKVRKRSRGLVCFFIGTNTKEMMIVSRVSRVVMW